MCRKILPILLPILGLKNGDGVLLRVPAADDLLHPIRLIEVAKKKAVLTGV